MATPDLSSDFICAICIEPLVAERNPRMLPCVHSFCAECLDGLIARSCHVSRDINCPECRKIWAVPEDGFPKNRFIKHSAEIKPDVKVQDCPKAPVDLLKASCKDPDLLLTKVVDIIKELDKYDKKLTDADKDLDAAVDKTLHKLDSELPQKIHDLKQNYEDIRSKVQEIQKENKEAIKEDKIKVLVMLISEKLK